MAYTSLTFASTVEYAAALRRVTDLGLQPSLPCNGARVAPGHWQRWTPTGNVHLLQHDHQMWVEPTPLAPDHWLNRLQQTPGILRVDRIASVFCPAILSGTPPVGEAAFLTGADSGHMLRAAFLATVSYDTALRIVSDLGLRLADPAREGAASPAAPWWPAGQESAFASTRALLVATTVNASTQWRSQLVNGPAVVAVNQIS